MMEMRYPLVVNLLQHILQLSPRHLTALDTSGFARIAVKCLHLTLEAVQGDLVLTDAGTSMSTCLHDTIDTVWLEKSLSLAVLA
jgi:hypothetical protein